MQNPRGGIQRAEFRIQGLECRIQGVEPKELNLESREWNAESKDLLSADKSYRVNIYLKSLINSYSYHEKLDLRAQTISILFQTFC